MKKFLDIGKIIDAHGLKGEIKVYPFNRDSSFMDNLKNVFIENREYDVKSFRKNKDLFLFLLDGITDRQTAESLRGKIIEMDRNSLPKLQQGDFYMVDIIGCSVYDDTGFLGTVTDIMETKSTDVYVVDGLSGTYKCELLIPAIKSVINDIDIENKKITVILPEGLLDNEYF